MADLFDGVHEGKRLTLRALGWADCPSFLGPRSWKAPDGALVDEDEAFLWLERHLVATGGSHEPE